jgi:PIN domain nuclease of toxin-antitoxin system
MFNKTLVLDTCALLWLVSGDSKLSKNALSAIDRASLVYVSDISAWEISLKATRKELILPMDAEEWYNAAIDKHSLISIPVNISIACSANKLPFYHKDPADRFIIATALALSSAIVTTDSQYSQYGVRIIG